MHNAAEHPLFRGMALANVLRCLAWPYEVEWNTSEPCTLHDLNPDDLRIVLEILSDELDEAHRLLSNLPIGEIEGCAQVPASGGPSLSVTHVARMRWRPLASSDASPLATDDGSEVEVWKIGGGIMPRKKRPKGERDVEARLNDIEASQWDESRMDAIVQRLDTELDEIIQRVERYLQHDVRPEHRQEFRERVRDLLDTFTDNLEDVLQGTAEHDALDHHRDRKIQTLVKVKEAKLMNRGLTLKCLQCDSDAFHILYTMAPQPGGVPHPRQSGSYECIQCGHVADEAEQEAMVAKIQREREAHEQGVKDDPEP